MRFEIVLILIVGGLLFHIYSDGKYLKQIMSYKKYMQMGGIVIGAVVLYLLVKKNPVNAKNIIMGSNEYLKYLPVDKNATSMLSPILDFTSKQQFSQNPISYSDSSQNRPIIPVPSIQRQQQEKKIMNSGKKGCKRSVSETKKKFVASRQQWKCNGCKHQLNAWFEVDHIVRLDHGGSNHIDNLVALCRECHGEKTAIENL